MRMKNENDFEAESLSSIFADKDNQQVKWTIKNFNRKNILMTAQLQADILF